MTVDEDRLARGFKILRDNLDTIAASSDGRFMNPYVRPKDKRVAFTKEQYVKDILARIKFWETTDEVTRDWQLNQFSGLADFVLQGVDNQFQRFRDIYYLLMQKPPETTNAELEASKAQTQKIRADQREMHWTDRKHTCAMCALPIFVRDINNNYIDLKAKAKREVCQCSAGPKLRSRLKKLREAKRAEQKKKQRIPKKDPLRYK